MLKLQTTAVRSHPTAVRRSLKQTEPVLTADSSIVRVHVMSHFGVYETSASAYQLQEDKLHLVMPTLSSAASIGKRFAHTQPADLDIADESAKFHLDAGKNLTNFSHLFP